MTRLIENVDRIVCDAHGHIRWPHHHITRVPWVTVYPQTLVNYDKVAKKERRHDCVFTDYRRLLRKENGRS